MTETRALIRLAIPLAAQQVGFQLMGTVDSALLGRYSDAALAGSGIGNTLLFAVTSIGMGIVMGLDTVIPQAVGGGRREDAQRALGAGLRLALLMGLVSTLFVMLSPVVLTAASVPADVVAEARVYTFARAIGITPFLATIAIRPYLAAHSRTRALVIATIVGNIVNALLDLVLIFGVPALGIPRLGVLGAAIATVSVQVVILAVYLFAVREIDARQPRLASTTADLKQIVHYGLPVGGHLFAEIGVFTLATVLAAHMGKIPVAAHTIALNLASFTFSFAVGLGAATSVRVGQAVGAGDLPLARRRGERGLGLGLGVMACCATVFVVAPATLASIYTSDRVVIAATIPLLQIAALFQLSDGTQAISAGAMRGRGLTRATFAANVVGHYVVGLPLALLLGFGAAMGAPGLWWGLSAGLTATALYLVIAFFRSTSRNPR